MAELEVFQARLQESNQVMNLVGPQSLPMFWSRHVQDSAQLLNYAPETQSWADVGAGAGFPGVVLAILLKDRPGTIVHLIDSQAKRCRFLQALVSEIELPAQVHCARAESLDLKVQMVTARACAPLQRLLGFCEPFFRKGAEGLFLKGESVQDELETAALTWRFRSELLPSLSDPRGRIVRIRGVRRVR